ncbi:unnamed protein product, partial [Brenthis ino]
MLLADVRVESPEDLLQREAVGGVQRDLGPAGRPARFLAHHRATPPYPDPWLKHNTILNHFTGSIRSIYSKH